MLEEIRILQYTQKQSTTKPYTDSTKLQLPLKKKLLCMEQIKILSKNNFFVSNVKTCTFCHWGARKRYVKSKIMKTTMTIDNNINCQNKDE